MNKRYPDNIVLRLILPTVAGLILYLAMLTVFDSLDQLAVSFFSQEAAFFVLLAYLNHELLIFMIRKGISSTLVYYTIILSSAVLLNSAFTTGYFIVILGYMHFRTELITIVILFSFFHILVSMYYLSIVQIEKVRDISLKKEESLAVQLDLELESYRNEINPGLLMKCLEILLDLIHTDETTSEKYVRSLSDHYRYMLEMRQKELISLTDEVRAASGLAYLLGYGKDPVMVLESRLESVANERIVPGALLRIIHWIHENMIISQIRSLKIIVKKDRDRNLVISHPYQPRLLETPDPETAMQKLNRSFEHFTGKKVDSGIVGDDMVWILPRVPGIKNI